MQYYTKKDATLKSRLYFAYKFTFQKSLLSQQFPAILFQFVIRRPFVHDEELPIVNFALNIPLQNHNSINYKSGITTCYLSGKL